MYSTLSSVAEGAERGFNTLSGKMHKSGGAFQHLHVGLRDRDLG